MLAMKTTFVASHVTSIAAAASSSASSSSSFSAQNHTSCHSPLSFFWGRHGKLVSSQSGGGKERAGSREGGVARAYLERSANPVGDFFSRVQGSLPIVGLLSRIMSDEGGVGADRLQLVEFCRKVEKSRSMEASRAFYDFQERHGPVAKPQYVLIWCWAAALGAGLLRSDDLLMSAQRLRVSYDIQYETENLELLMDDAAKKREQRKSPVINVPMEARAEIALDAIMKCCTGSSYLEEDDVPLLNLILTAVFPSADASQIDRIVNSRLLTTDEEDDSGVDAMDSQELDVEEGIVGDIANSLAQ